MKQPYNGLTVESDNFSMDKFSHEASYQDNSPSSTATCNYTAKNGKVIYDNTVNLDVHLIIRDQKTFKQIIVISGAFTIIGEGSPQKKVNLLFDFLIQMAKDWTATINPDFDFPHCAYLDDDFVGTFS